MIVSTLSRATREERWRVGQDKEWGPRAESESRYERREFSEQGEGLFGVRWCEGIEIDVCVQLSPRARAWYALPTLCREVQRDARKHRGR